MGISGSDRISSFQQFACFEISVKECLDKMPVKCRIDFATVAEALKSVVDPLSSHLVPSSLKETIQNLQDGFNHPERYGRLPQDAITYKYIIFNLTVAKIEQLTQLLVASEDQRSFYIENQLHVEQLRIR